MADAERLYYADSLLLDFDATVQRHVEHRGRAAIVLDRSAFYPESGGQMADHGRLVHDATTVDVVDVQLLDGDMVHVLDGPLPAVGSSVEGRVDKRRRRVHMALHTGQHILSRALTTIAQAETVSSRLGETSCTIDVDKEHIDDHALSRVEDLTNAIIDDDVPVRAFFPSSDELAKLSLRRKAKVDGPVRVVTIGDFDTTPCGGTHCTRSAQVGLVSITSIERHKRRVRLSFAAGKRARTQLGREASALRELGRSFSCGPLGVGEQIDKLRRELGSATDALQQGHEMLAQRLAETLTASPAIATFDALPLPILRAIAKHLDADSMLATRSAEGVHVVVTRGAGSALDCSVFFKRAAAIADGRGGGRPDRAEGRFPADIDWEAVAQSALSPQP